MTPVFMDTTESGPAPNWLFPSVPCFITKAGTLGEDLTPFVQSVIFYTTYPCSRSQPGRAGDTLDWSPVSRRADTQKQPFTLTFAHLRVQFRPTNPKPRARLWTAGGNHRRHGGEHGWPPLAALISFTSLWISTQIMVCLQDTWQQNACLLEHKTFGIEALSFPSESSAIIHMNEIHHWV